MRVNLKDRPHDNPLYLDFIRNLPCAICWKWPHSRAHHTYVTGRKASQNDLYAVPLCDYHHTGKGHITRDALEIETGEDVRDLCLCYISAWLDLADNQYSLEMDREMNFRQLKIYRRVILK